MRITDQFREKLNEEIRKVEKVSSVEIVPVLIRSASPYLLFRSSYSLGAAFLCALILPTFWLAISSDAVSLALLFVVYFILGKPTFLVKLVPKSYKHMKVARRAHEIFLAEEVFATKERTGLLILVSELEKSVFILADKGFKGKVEDRKWSELSTLLAKDFSKHSPGDTFLQALKQLLVELKEVLPVRDGDKDELPNYLRTR